jgi:hypothetical protein
MRRAFKNTLGIENAEDEDRQVIERAHRWDENSGTVNQWGLLSNLVNGKTDSTCFQLPENYGKRKMEVKTSAESRGKCGKD